MGRRRRMQRIDRLLVTAGARLPRIAVVVQQVLQVGGALLGVSPAAEHAQALVLLTHHCTAATPLVGERDRAVSERDHAAVSGRGGQSILWRS